MKKYLFYKVLLVKFFLTLFFLEFWKYFFHRKCYQTQIFHPYFWLSQKFVLAQLYFDPTFFYTLYFIKSKTLGWIFSYTKKSIFESFLTNFNWILNMYGTTFLTNFNWMLNLYWTNKSKDTSPKIDLDSNIFSLNF